jgi:hypothetical protein
LHLGTDKPRHIDVGEADKEIEDHDKEHGPGKAPDSSPRAPLRECTGSGLKMAGVVCAHVS